jgi:hypothetical protein
MKVEEGERRFFARWMKSASETCEPILTRSKQIVMPRKQKKRLVGTYAYTEKHYRVYTESEESDVEANVKYAQSQRTKNEVAKSMPADQYDADKSDESAGEHSIPNDLFGEETSPPGKIGEGSSDNEDHQEEIGSDNFELSIDPSSRESVGSSGKETCMRITDQETISSDHSELSIDPSSRESVGCSSGKETCMRITDQETISSDNVGPMVKDRINDQETISSDDDDLGDPGPAIMDSECSDGVIAMDMNHQEIYPPIDSSPGEFANMSSALWRFTSSQYVQGDAEGEGEGDG